MKEYKITRWKTFKKSSNSMINFIVTDGDEVSTKYKGAIKFMSSDISGVYTDVLKYKAKENAKLLRDKLEYGNLSFEFDSRVVTVQVDKLTSMTKILAIPVVLDTKDMLSPENAPNTVEPNGWRMADNSYEKLTASDFRNIIMLFAYRSAKAFALYEQDLQLIEQGDLSLLNLNGVL